MIDNRLMYIFNCIVFLMFVLVVMLRVLANFNMFDYSFSVILPLIFIPIYLLSKFFYPIKTININLLNKELLLYYLILFNFIFIPIFQFILFDNLIDDLGRSSFEFTVTISLLCISWFLLGCLMARIKVIPLLFYYIILISMAVSFYLMYTSFGGQPFVDYYYISSLRIDSIKIQHLSLTEPLTFVLFLFLSISYMTKFKWISILFIIFIFLSLGGRTAFFCALLTIIIYELIISNFLSYLIKVSLVSFLSIIILLSLNFSDNIFFDKLFFKGGLDSDESYKGRVEFLFDFFDGFLNQILIGYPNFFIEKHNDLGTYSHNILSIFQFYGLILFLVVIYSIYLIIKKIIKYEFYKSTNSLDIFGVLLFIYVLLSIITGKAVLFSPLWFVLGFLLFRLRHSVEKQSYV